jgi:hypothetical protein
MPKILTSSITAIPPSKTPYAMGGIHLVEISVAKAYDDARMLS